MSESDSYMPDAYIPGEGPYDQFILFGDSLTQFSSSQSRGFAFQPALQDDYIRRLDVINRGFAGYNTAHAKLVLPRIMPTPAQAKVAFMTIFFGANDACLPQSKTGQHVSLQRYAENLEQIIQNPLIRAHNPRIMLITPPPISEHLIEADDYARGGVEAIRKSETTRSYAQACCQVGKKLNVPVVDLWTSLMERAGWREGQPLAGSKATPRNRVLEGFFSDGLHFLPPAYQVLYEEVTAMIQRTWPEDVPQAQPPVFPLWRDAPQ